MIILTLERLKEVLEYSPSTGIFVWKKSLSNKGKVGCVAGTHDAQGYRLIGIDNEEYKAHRLAIFYVNGQWPAHDVDHINGVRDDNKIQNLRSVSHGINSQNLRQAKINNRTQMLGVSPSGRRFKAQIMLNGKQHNLGRFATPVEAHEVYLRAKRSIHIGGTL